MITQIRSMMFAAMKCAGMPIPEAVSRHMSTRLCEKVRRCVTSVSTPRHVIDMTALVGTEERPQEVPCMKPTQYTQDTNETRNTYKNVQTSRQRACTREFDAVCTCVCV